MTDLEKSIREYLKELNLDEKVIDRGFNNTTILAQYTCVYAHGEQRRINGQAYARHPFALKERYREIMGRFKFDGDALMDCGVPYWNVQALCYLHDVIEDTDVDPLELEMMLKEHTYGPETIDELMIALDAITHRKGESHDDYLIRLLENPLASFVKLFDLEDNLKLLNLTTFGKYEYQRAKRYLKFFSAIENKYHYLEKIEEYQNTPRNIYDDWDNW